VFGPEQGGQRFAAMGLSGLDGQIGQESLFVDASKTAVGIPLSIAADDLKTAEKSQIKLGHLPHIVTLGLLFDHKPAHFTTSGRHFVLQ
jgi:hypothetical protein